MSRDAASPEILDHFAPLAARYDALLSDIWGVVHNGVRAHADAVDALARFRQERGGAVVLITNAPRPADKVRETLRHLGVPDEAYDRIITSGDLTRDLVRARLGQRMHHVGPGRDHPIFQGLGIEQAPVADADYVLCSGLDDDSAETPDDYRDRLRAMQARGLEMICANPDLMVERGDELIYCAGAVAAAYEAQGGRVIYAGKPHPPIYEAAFALFDEVAGARVDRGRILAIGDNVRTDLAGAAAAGLDMLFITAGVHAGELDAPEGLEKLFETAPARPLAVQRKLRW